MERLYSIRGKRILDQIDRLDEKSTGSMLYQNTGKIPTKKRQHAVKELKVGNVSLIPAVPSGILNVKSEIRSGEKTYQTTIVFSEVNFEDQDSPTNVTFTGADDEEYNIEKIQLRAKYVKVSCNCLDFYWRFAPNNKRDDSLHGKPPPPHTPKTGRAPVNPKKYPGVCKHIIKTVEDLRASGILN